MPIVHSLECGVLVVLALTGVTSGESVETSVGGSAFLIAITQMPSVYDEIHQSMSCKHIVINSLARGVGIVIELF
jgi:hypothetical protein